MTQTRLFTMKIAGAPAGRTQVSPTATDQQQAPVGSFCPDPCRQIYLWWSPWSTSHVVHETTENPMKPWFGSKGLLRRYDWALLRTYIKSLRPHRT